MVSDSKEIEAKILLRLLCMDLFACVHMYICIQMYMCIIFFILVKGKNCFLNVCKTCLYVCVSYNVSLNNDEYKHIVILRL